MAELVPPHGGGDLKPLLAPSEQRAKALVEAASLTKVAMTSREVSDLFMLGMGAYTPLPGLHRRSRLARRERRHEAGERRVLADSHHPVGSSGCGRQDLGRRPRCPGATVRPARSWGPSTSPTNTRSTRRSECEHVYRTTDEAHPGVEKVMQQGEVNLAGPVTVLSEGHFPETYKELYLRPEQSRSHVHRARLVARRRIPDPQPDAPQP